jgi:polyhydroxyalkanoate synthesis regulator phasin
MKKLVGSVAIVAALGAGAFAISTVLPAGAQSSPPSTSSTAPPTKGGGRAAAKSALDGLVQKGTITQDQENAVIQALQGALTGQRPGRLHQRIVGGMLKVAADKIGVQPKDLVQARRNGQSIADVANAHHVDPSDVVNAIVAAANQRVDQAVTNGRLSQDKANALKAKVPQLAEKFVNATGAGGRTSGGPSAGSSSSAPSSSSSS